MDWKIKKMILNIFNTR